MGQWYSGISIGVTYNGWLDNEVSVKSLWCLHGMMISWNRRSFSILRGTTLWMSCSPASDVVTSLQRACSAGGVRPGDTQKVLVSRSRCIGSFSHRFYRLDCKRPHFMTTAKVFTNNCSYCHLFACSSSWEMCAKALQFRNMPRVMSQGELSPHRGLCQGNESLCFHFWKIMKNNKKQKYEMKKNMWERVLYASLIRNQTT